MNLDDRLQWNVRCAAMFRSGLVASPAVVAGATSEVCSHYTQVLYGLGGLTPPAHTSGRGGDRFLSKPTAGVYHPVC